MDRRHKRSPRSYAEVAVDGRPGFAFAQALRSLPATNRWALYAHEVGHVLDPDGGEEDADAAAARQLGAQIAYDHRWPGKGLQTLREVPMRRRNYGQDHCETGVVFDDGFCSPRGQLEEQPGRQWERGCRREVAITMSGDLGHLTAAEVAKNSRCSLSSARKYLREMERGIPPGQPWVEGWDEMRGLDKTGRRLYEAKDRLFDYADWVVWKDGQRELEGSGEPEDPLRLAGHEDAADPWDWSEAVDWSFAVDVEAPADPQFDPWVLTAWSTDLPEYPIGELVLFGSGKAVYDIRSFGRVGSSDYAPVGRMRVHPAYREAGVTTALMERASQVAADHLGVALASGDARTPGQAAWWTQQVKRGRAKKIRHRSRRHPEASRYLLSYPPPESLELGSGERRATQTRGRGEGPVPFNNPCLPCLFL